MSSVKVSLSLPVRLGPLTSSSFNSSHDVLLVISCEGWSLNSITFVFVISLNVEMKTLIFWLSTFKVTV